MQDTGLRSDLTSMFVLLMLFQEDKADRRPVPERVKGEEQGGTCLPRGQRNRWPLPRHTHTPTGPGYGCHSGVKGQGGRWTGRSGDTGEQGWMRKPRGGGDRESRERGRQGYGRSLLIHMPDITITLLIQWDTNTDEVRGGEPKQRHKRNREGRGGEGVSWVGERQMGEDNRVPTFSSTSNSRTFQWISRTQNRHVWHIQTPQRPQL